jgi:hypothetical protein
MIGVRSAVTTECPTTTYIRMHGHEDGKPAFWAYFSKSTKWTPIVLFVGSADKAFLEMDARQAIAQIDARALNALTGAQHVTMLENPSRAVDAEWRISNVRLGLTVQTPDSSASSLSSVVRKAASQVARACASVDGANVDLVARQLEDESFVCRNPSHTFAYAVLTYNYGPQRFVIGMYSPRAELDNGRNLAAVLSAFKKVIVEEW